MFFNEMRRTGSTPLPQSSFLEWVGFLSDDDLIRSQKGRRVHIQVLYSDERASGKIIVLEVVEIVIYLPPIRDVFKLDLPMTHLDEDRCELSLSEEADPRRPRELTTEMPMDKVVFPV